MAVGKGGGGNSVAPKNWRNYKGGRFSPFPSLTFPYPPVYLLIHESQSVQQASKQITGDLFFTHLAPPFLPGYMPFFLHFYIKLIY